MANTPKVGDFVACPRLGNGTGRYKVLREEGSEFVLNELGTNKNHRIYKVHTHHLSVEERRQLMQKDRANREAAAAKIGAPGLRRK